MISTAPSGYSGLLLALYRLSLECPIELFQDAALRLVRTQLPFDSSMWGTATHTDSGIDIHTIHLHNQPVEMLAAYEAVKELDTAAVAVSKSLSSTLVFNSAAWFSDRSQRPLLNYGNRFEQRNFFISSTLNPETKFTHWVTLFRADADAHGREEERVLLAALTPHLQQSLEHNRILHLDRMEVPHQAQRGAAIADQRGMLYHFDKVFAEALREESDRWKPPGLPADLLQLFKSGVHISRGHRWVMTCRVERDLLFLHMRPRCRADDLTAKEFAVAVLIAQGKTHKEVALELRRAPGTVRNHIQSIYDKLGVSNVAGLIDQLHLAA